MNTEPQTVALALHAAGGIPAGLLAAIRLRLRIAGRLLVVLLIAGVATLPRAIVRLTIHRRVIRLAVVGNVTRLLITALRRLDAELLLIARR